MSRRPTRRGGGHFPGAGSSHRDTPGASSSGHAARAGGSHTTGAASGHIDTSGHDELDRAVIENITRGGGDGVRSTYDSISPTGNTYTLMDMCDLYLTTKYNLFYVMQVVMSHLHLALTIRVYTKDWHLKRQIERVAIDCQ